MAVPGFVTSSQFSVAASHNPAALLTVSLLSLAVNVAVLIYQVRTIVTRRLNPLTDELYAHLPQYAEVLAANAHPADAERSELHRVR